MSCSVSCYGNNFDRSEEKLSDFSFLMRVVHVAVTKVFLLSVSNAYVWLTWDIREK